MRFPDNFIEEVVERTDIEELVGRYVTLKRTGANLVGLCPFHSEKTPSFTVTPAKKMFYCFGCHAGGSAITFAQKVENLDYPDAIEFLANRAGLPLPVNQDAGNEPERVSRKRILEMNLEAAKFFRACLFDPQYGAEGLAYLRETRKLSDATIKHFGLGFAPNQFGLLTEHMHKLGYSDEELQTGFLCGKSQKTGRSYDYYRNRVIFPIIDTTGNIVGFGGRVMDDSKPKYLNTSDTPAFKKSNHLFALNYARHSCGEQIILCEGYMDVIAMHAAGFENAVATLGTAITPNHARILSKYTKKVILSYDSDEAGQNATKKAMHVLGEVGLEVRVLKIDGAKDPDEYIKKFGADRFRRVLEGSRTGFEHQLESVLAKYDLSVNTEKIRATGELCKMISEYSSAIEREVYLAAVSAKLELPKDILANRVKDLRSKQAQERQSEQRREAQNTVKSFGDKINPDAAKNLKVAAAEEEVLGFLLLFEEYRQEVLTKQNLLTDTDFITEFHRKVFGKIMERQASGIFREELLGADFSPDEMGRIREMEVTRQQFTENGPSRFYESVKMLKQVRKEKELREGDLGAKLAFLRQRNANKGKSDE